MDRTPNIRTMLGCRHCHHASPQVSVRLRTGGKPTWEMTGPSFIQRSVIDNNRTQLSTVYIDTSHLRWEEEQFEGKAAIVEKSSSLLFQKIQHSITVQDRQPTSANCILSMLVGPPKANEDPITGLHQMFLGKDITDAWGSYSTYNDECDFAPTLQELLCPIEEIPKLTGSCRVISVTTGVSIRCYGMGMRGHLNSHLVDPSIPQGRSDICRTQQHELRRDEMGENTECSGNVTQAMS
ncbi:hypothetical protein H8959_011311 [Pygathrix nigripes]